MLMVGWGLERNTILLCCNMRAKKVSVLLNGRFSWLLMVNLAFLPSLLSLAMLNIFPNFTVFYIYELSYYSRLLLALTY